VSVGHGCSYLVFGVVLLTLMRVFDPDKDDDPESESPRQSERQAAALCSKAMNTERGQDEPDNARFELDYQLSLP